MLAPRPLLELPPRRIFASGGRDVSAPLCLLGDRAPLPLFEPFGPGRWSDMVDMQTGGAEPGGGWRGYTSHEAVVSLSSMRKLRRAVGCRAMQCDALCGQLQCPITHDCSILVRTCGSG